MAIQKKIDLYNTGVECEIWRIDNVPIFREHAAVSVSGWLNKEHYDGDKSKTNRVYAKQYTVRDTQAVNEQLDFNGEMEIPFQPATTCFTDYFSNAALLKSGASPLSNGYDYLLTLPEFEGGTQV